MRVSEHTMLETALPVFKSRGIRATQLSDIAQACGIPVKELKNRFNSKEDLVSAFVEYLLARHTGYLQVNPVLSPTATTELENFFLFIERMTSELTPAILFELEKYSITAWHRLTEFKDRMLAPYLKENLKRGVSQGFYRDDVQIELCGAMYFNVLRVIVTDLTGYSGESGGLLPQFHKIFLRGLLSKRGLRM